MEVNKKLKDLYENYYANGAVVKKRAMTAVQTVGHVEALLGQTKVNSILDVGAGDGAVLVELVRKSIGTSYSAVDISQSGVDEIAARNIPALKEVMLFDGYRIPFADNSFDLALGIHVIEHVEHERVFIRERQIPGPDLLQARRVENQDFIGKHVQQLAVR